jgi:hypothetical protein
MKKVNAEVPQGNDKKEPTKAQGCMALILFAIAAVAIVYSVYILLSL